MKICTITCHDVYNAGASLQAYALVSYLHTAGHEARIINYKPDYLSGHHALTGVANPRYDKPVLRTLYTVALLPGRLCRRFGKRKKRFDAFTREYLPLTERYVSFDELNALPPQADVYLAGSDQIWNTSFPNGRDPAFYLAFAPVGAVKASYAASFASDAADPTFMAQQAAWISALDGVAVREQSGLSILSELGISGGITVADPVFLLPAADWRVLTMSVPVHPRPYILVYDFDGSDGIRQSAEALKKQTGYDILTLQKLPFGDRCVVNAGPREFVSLIDNAAFVLSNSFHATAFSLILHTPFMVYDRREKLNSRMRDLMERVGLSERRTADEPIDWQDTDARLAQAVDASRTYIADMLRLAAEPTGKDRPI